MDLAAKTRGKTAGIVTLSTSSRHHPAFKELLEKNNVYKDLKEKLTTRDCLHLDPILEKLRTRCTEVLHLNIFSNAATSVKPQKILKIT